MRVAAQRTRGPHRELHEQRRRAGARARPAGPPAGRPSTARRRAGTAARCRRRAVDPGDHVQRLRLVVERVPVVADEQPLLLDEHPVAHREVLLELAAARQASASSVVRPTKRSSSPAPSSRRSTRSHADRPEHAWQRAQPAFASRWSKPASASIADDLGVDARRRSPGSGGSRVGHQRPRHGPQRHDERVDAHRDRAPAAVDDQLLALAHARAARTSSRCRGRTRRRRASHVRK